MVHGLGALLTCAAVGYRLATPQEEHLSRVVWVWIGATIIYLLAVVLITAWRECPASVVLFWAVVMRAASLGDSPHLTTDYHRYLWDGKVQRAGINPYRFAPADPALKALRDDNWKGINFRRIPTIYPPTSQLVFRLIAAVGGVEALRWVLLLCEGTTWLALVILLRRQGEPPQRVVWFAWCPLAVVEVAANLHQDIVGIAFLLIAMTARGVVGGAALALSVMAKGYALALAPLFLRVGRWRFAMGFAAAVVVVSAPYIRAGRNMTTGLGKYLRGWRGHAIVYPALVRLFARITTSPERWAAGAAGVMLLLLVVLRLRRTRRRRDLPAAVGTLLGAVLLLSPVVFPWYVLWVAALLPLTRSLPWAVFTCSILAAYSWFLRRRTVPGIEAVEYLPLALTWAGTWLAEKRRLRTTSRPSIS